MKLSEALPSRFTKTVGGGATQRPGFGPISSFAKMINLVIYNKNDKFADKKNRDLFLSYLSRYLERKTTSLDYDYLVIKPDEKIKNLKFYPKTNKIIGIFPHYMFKKGKVKYENFVYYDEFKKLFPDIEMKEKQKIG